MRIRLAGLLAFAGLTTFTFAQDKPADKPAEKPAPAGEAKKNGAAVTAASAKSVLDFSMKTIDGTPVDLSKYKGKVVMIVNVASKCGLTPQYEQLQALHEKYAAKGLAVLAIPSNDFNGQEPGTNAEIKEFCKTKFGVGFDLFEKVPVKGEEASELYKFLTAADRGEKLAGPIKWNFTKFLIDREGKLVERFEPRVKPDDKQVTAAIEAALDAKK
ncbi:MAG: glutathione peroxidase [Phycisphaerae bacterium]